MGLGPPVSDFKKDGYSLELEFPIPIISGLRAFLVQDGMSVRDIYLSAGGPTPTVGLLTTDDRNYVVRGVAGLEYAASRGFLIRGSAERWNFSDYENAWVYHLGVLLLY